MHRLFIWVIPLVLIILFNFILTHHLEQEAQSLSDSLNKQRVNIHDLKNRVIKEKFSQDDISAYIVKSDITELNDNLFCSFKRKDNLVISFLNGRYIVAEAEGAIPFHYSDFNFWIIEKGEVILNKNKIHLRKDNYSHVEKILFFIKRDDERVLYSYGEALMPFRHCTEIQKHLFGTLKEKGLYKKGLVLNKKVN